MVENGRQACEISWLCLNCVCVCAAKLNNATQKVKVLWVSRIFSGRNQRRHGRSRDWAGAGAGHPLFVHSTQHSVRMRRPLESRLEPRRRPSYVSRMYVCVCATNETIKINRRPRRAEMSKKISLPASKTVRVLHCKREILT